jgi:coproporphyrinogen III oxidase
MNPAAVKHYLLGLQQRIVAALENLDGKRFREDRWDRREGGGGISRVSGGKLFERGGVNFSHVQGRAAALRQRLRPELAGRRGKPRACRWCCIRATLIAPPCT